jgi:hypothetical protein
MMKAWERKYPVKLDKVSPDSVTHRLVSQPIETTFEIEKVSFEPHPDANPASRVAGLIRFQVRLGYVLSVRLG